MDLQHYISELKHILYGKDDQIKSMEEDFNLKMANLNKVKNAKELISFDL